MIGTVNVYCNASRPQMPLEPMTAFKGSPSSIRVLDVPKKIGDWTITQVYVSAKYPDNTISTKECVRVGNVWVGTIDACDTPGDTENGFVIGANGIDENGEEVNGYILGVGDVMILDGDTQFHPDIQTYSIHLLDEMPDDPKIGDAYFDQGLLRIWHNDAWNRTVQKTSQLINDNNFWVNGSSSLYIDGQEQGSTMIAGNHITMERDTADPSISIGGINPYITISGINSVVSIDPTQITIGNNIVATQNNIKNNKITIKQGGVEKGYFTLNQGSDKTIELDAGGGGDTKCLMNISNIGSTYQYVSWTSGSDNFKVMRNDMGRLQLLKNGTTQTDYSGAPTIIAEVDGNITIYDGGYPSETSVILDNVRQSSYSPLNTTGKKILNISMQDCLEQDTLISMADGSTKRVADLWIGDKVLSMNPDTLELEEDEVSDCDGGILKSHNLTDIWNFSDGTTIKTVKPHQFFNTRTNKMEYIANFQIGDGVKKQDGSTPTFVSHEQRRGLVYHNTLYTKKFNNYFANGILTGNRHSKKWGWYYTQHNQEV